MIKSYDAFTQFNAVFVSGLQEISTHVCTVAQSTIDLNLETGKAVMSVKSPQDLAALQSKWVQQFFETALSGAAKLSAISTKLASQAAEPVHSHIYNAVDKITSNVTKPNKAA